MITLMHAYARSGATLLNRILAAMPDNVVMSEVLPPKHTGSTLPGVQSGGIYHQALYWYDIRLKNKDYIPAILELADVCQRNGRHLIVREWTAGCYYWQEDAFLPKDNIPPPYGLWTLNHLPNKEQTRPFALVRHGADTFKSLHPNDHDWSDETAQYAKAYLAYAQDVHESRMPVYDYAELCAHPYEFITKLCSDFDIPFDKTALSRFAHIITACGDTGYRGRHADSTTIRPLKRRILPDITQENLYRNNADFRRADSLLGLQPDTPIEPDAHTTTKKPVTIHDNSPLPELLPCEDINATPLWRFDDITDSQRIQAPPPSAPLKRHLAELPPNCAVVVLYARHFDNGVIDTLKALDDAPADFPPRAFIVMTHKKRIFLSLPKHLRSRTYIHALKEDTGEMPDSSLKTLSLMRALVAHNKHHTLFLCSKHIIITARHVLPRLLGLCPPHDTATALSYGHTGIDTHPLFIHRGQEHSTSRIGHLSARGARGTPFADRRILFDPKASNNQPLMPQRQMDFVQRYPDFIRRPFINWTKVYDSKGALLVLFADHNSVWLATAHAQKHYGTLTKQFRSDGTGSP